MAFLRLAAEDELCLKKELICVQATGTVRRGQVCLFFNVSFRGPSFAGRINSKL
jgi:hypothetical protein